MQKTTETRQQFIDRLSRLKDDALDSETYWTVDHEDVVRAIDLRYTDFAKSRFRDQNFSDLNLTGFAFHKAYVVYTLFTGAILCHAGFVNATLTGSVFHSANMRNVDLCRADLEETDFANADLMYAYLLQASLSWVKGFKVVAPVGRAGRLIYAYTRNGEIRIQAGCRNATPDDMRTAIRNTYHTADRRDDRNDYLDAVKLLESWGKREIKRVRKLGLLD